MRLAKRLCLYATLAAPFSLSSFASAQGTSNKDDHRNCYFPNGVQSSGSPCFPDRAVSPCCGPGFICLSNGLCQPGPDTRRTYQYKIYRSSCTDMTWNSTDCPKICISPDDNLDAGQGLATCGTNGSYCCGRGYDCCSNGTDIFQYGTANIVTTIPYTGSSAATATSSSSSSSSSSPSSSSSSSSSSSNDSAIKIGVGVGVGVGGFALLVAGVAVFLLLRRNKRLRRNAAAGSDDYPPPRRAGSELPGQSMKEESVGAGVTSSPPTYGSPTSATRTHSYPQSPVSNHEGGATEGGMTPGAMLNPAEVGAGLDQERFEMEGQQPGTWKGSEVRTDGRRHELEG